MLPADPTKWAITAFRVVEGDEGREMRIVWRDGGTLRYRTLTRHQVWMLRRWFDEHEAECVDRDNVSGMT